MSSLPEKIQLCEPYESVRQLPLNINLEDKIIFSHELRRQVEGCYLLKLQNVIISGNNLFIEISKDRLPKELTFNNNILYVNYVSAFLKKLKWLLQGRYKKIKAPVVLITDYWSHGYFHWITEVLPRLLIAKDWISESAIVLPSYYQQLPFIKESIKAVGIYNVIYLKKDTVYELDSVLFPTHFAESGILNDKYIRLLRSLFLKLKNTNLEKVGRLIYISRRNANKRKVTNEDQLICLLERYNFEVVYAERLTFIEQKNLFTNTHVLLTNHGAGLTNMIFMKEAAKVIELRHINDKNNNCYFALASALRLSYFYILCKPATQGEDPHTADLNINLIALDCLLKSIINNKCVE